MKTLARLQRLATRLGHEGRVFADFDSDGGITYSLGEEELVHVCAGGTGKGYKGAAQLARAALHSRKV